jgi:uncharacterized protein (DUF779 family)
MPRRVTVTPAALEELGRLRAQHGELVIHLSGGCCDGSSPMCLSAAALPPGPADVEVGRAGGIRVVIDADLDERWGRPAFVLGVAPGAAGGFSLEALDDVHFTLRAPG